MKKFYLLLIAMMIGVAAHAVDIYLIGGFNNWTLKDNSVRFTDKGNNVFELNYQGTLTSGFKINDGSWSGAYNLGSNTAIGVGETITLNNSGSSANITIKGGNIENPTLTVDLSKLTLTITGKSVEASYTYSLHGTLESSSWADLDLIENNGKWVAEEVTVKNADFGIKKKDASTGSQVDWISASSASDAVVVLDKAISCMSEGTNFSIAAGTYTFTFDPKAMTLLVTGKSSGDDPDPDVNYDEWYVNILGDFNNWQDNGVNPVNGISTHNDLAIGTTGFKVKIWNGSADEYYVGDGNAIPVGEWVQLYLDAYDAKPTQIEGATATSAYNVEFDCKTNKIRVTPVGDDPDPDPNPDVNDEEWYVNVIGPFNDWQDNGIHPVNGIATHDDLAIGTEGFKVKTWNGSADAYYVGDGNAIPVGEWVQLYLDAYDAKPTQIEGAEADSHYKVEFDCKNNKVRVTKGSSAVTTVVEDNANAGAVYYNLQGVRVDNPTNGLYLRRQGDKVTKVIVR